MKGYLPVRTTITKTQRMTSVDIVMEEEGRGCTVGGDVECTASTENSTEVPQKTRTTL